MEQKMMRAEARLRPPWFRYVEGRGQAEVTLVQVC